MRESIDMIFTEVGKDYGYTLEQLKEKNNKPHISLAKAKATAICKDLIPKITTSQIAANVGVTNHTTILHRIKTHKNSLAIDKEYRRRYLKITSKLIQQINTLPYNLNRGSDEEKIRNRLNTIKREEHALSMYLKCLKTINTIRP